jgi:hypothetical protein
MSGPNPHCHKCSGKGYYRGPWYSDFEPRIVNLTCDCFEHSRPTKGEIFVLVAGFLALLTLMIVGAQ